MATLTNEEAKTLGQSCLDAVDGNLLVGSFAAELVGESYPFSKDMCSIVFKSYTTEQLGNKFANWMDKSNG